MYVQGEKGSYRIGTPGGPQQANSELGSGNPLLSNAPAVP
jgi:hypothetical protein